MPERAVRSREQAEASDHGDPPSATTQPPPRLNLVDSIL